MCNCSHVFNLKYALGKSNVRWKFGFGVLLGIWGTCGAVLASFVTVHMR